MFFPEAHSEPQLSVAQFWLLQSEQKHCNLSTSLPEPSDGARASASVRLFRELSLFCPWVISTISMIEHMIPIE